MSGMWNPVGRPRKMKKPAIAGHTIETRKGGLYVVPRNRKGKSMWEQAKYLGEAPVTPLDSDELAIMTDVEPEYDESVEAEGVTPEE